MPAVATPSMSEGFRPASAMAFSAASACRPITDTSGILPIWVVSAAPTTATDFGFMVLRPRRLEEGERDVVALLGEGDLHRHVELQGFGRLRAVDDVGHHGRALGQLHHGDGVGL